MTTFLAFLCVANPPAVSAAPAGCTVAGEHCVDKGGTRTFLGLQIERDCWEKQIFYSCPGGPCSTLSGDTDCTHTGTSCVKRDKSGFCLDEDRTFRCSKTKNGNGITLKKTVVVVEKHEVRSPIQCGKNFYCPGGTCDGLGKDEASTDFTRAASWMG
ncbi:MAG: conjugal transfer protein TraN, partial [bacterium]|nr:conjugal transfer protein TraN [bacterium]